MATFYACNAYQTIVISFFYLNDTFQDICLEEFWNETDLVESLIDAGALYRNNGDKVKLRTCIIGNNKYYEDIDVLDCLCDIKKDEEGFANFTLRIPIADVLVERICEYSTADYGDVCDIKIYGAVYNELVDGYMTNDSINVDKVEKVFKDYFGKYLMMNNFRVEVLPFTEKELDELVESDVFY